MHKRRKKLMKKYALIKAKKFNLLVKQQRPSQSNCKYPHESVRKPRNRRFRRQSSNPTTTPEISPTYDTVINLSSIQLAPD